MKRWTVLIVAAGFANIMLGELSVDEIVERANQASYYAGDDGSADVTMTITDRGGSTRSREFTVLRMNTGARTQKFYVYFNKPADLYKQVFLVWKEVAEGKDDSRWMWLPALNLKRSIAPGDKRTSFVGSDFVYEDVSGRNLREDIHELVETTADQYVIKNTPVKPDSVEFASYTIWIDKATMLPRKAEYYDKTGKLSRTVEATKVEVVQGFPTVVESVAKDLNSGSTTVNTYAAIKYNIGLNERIFTERFLSKTAQGGDQVDGGAEREK